MGEKRIMLNKSDLDDSEESEEEEFSEYEAKIRRRPIQAPLTVPNLIDYLPKWSSPRRRKESKFLFEKTILNAESNFFYIPKAKAYEHFPRETNELLLFNSYKTMILVVQDFHTRDQSYYFPFTLPTWLMKFVYFPYKKCYGISIGWKAFVAAHKLEAGDVVRFYKNINPLEHKRYYIDCLKGTKLYGFGLVLFFQKELTRNDVSAEALQVPTAEGERHFPGLKNGKEEQILVSDAEKKMQYWMRIKIFLVYKAYVIFNGWSEFVSAHDLKARDVIRFFKIVENVENDNNYLIDYVRS